MEEKNYKCYMCKYLEKFYTKGTRKFTRADFGQCNKRKCVVDIHGICENFVYKSKNRNTKDSVKVWLNNLLSEIATVRSIIEEEQNGKEL